MAEETDKTSLKQLIQGMASNGTEVLQGIVKSENPLKIQIVNDEKLIIGPNITYVPRHLTDYTTMVDIVQGGGGIAGSTATDGSHTHLYSGNTEGGGNPVHSHTYSGETQGKPHSHTLSTLNIYGVIMTVRNSLKAGEKVHVLAFNHSKQYYVLDRVS